MPIVPPEKENTYFVDIDDGAETARLVNQARLLTENLGGLFPTKLDLSTVYDILDLACGPGAWALDVAHAYPDMNIVGVDTDSTMVRYAAAQARVEGLDNISFEQADILKPLEFADASFDLVNARLLQGFMPNAAWPRLLNECWRILRTGGIIILTECETPITNSAEFEKMAALANQAVKLAGISFSPDGRHTGITPMLGPLLRAAGFQNVENQAYAVDFSAGTRAHNSVIDDMAVLAELLKPFLIKHRVSTQEELDRLYNEMATSVNPADFCGIWFYLSVFGKKP
jgi:ubiquinone/menaquinone biosynthesis C-methylase UbiE